MTYAPANGGCTCVNEIFALAADYPAADGESAKFFQIMQNKLHFAVTGQTAPQLISGRADHTKLNMRLTTWKGARVQKSDVTIAKNYPMRRFNRPSRLDGEDRSAMTKPDSMWVCDLPMW